MLLRLLLPFLGLWGNAEAVRLTNGPKDAQITAPPARNKSFWVTLHDIDAEQSAALSQDVRAEENCPDCIAGDVKLPPGFNASSLMEGVADLGTTFQERPWPNAIIYYRMVPGIASEARDVILVGMRHWEAKSCVRFQEVAAPSRSCKGGAECFPVVMSSDQAGCWSHTGYYAADFQAFNLGQGCWTVGVAVHELGHVLGLFHQHQRLDYGEYVEVVQDNFQADFKSGPSYAAAFDVKPWFGGQPSQLPYDLASIMHYDGWAFAKTHDYKNPATATLRVKKSDSWGNCKIGQRVQLSVGDVLAVSHMYGCKHNFCADMNAHCGEWARLGNCQSEQYRPYMQIHCRATCGICECKDLVAESECASRLVYCPHRLHGTGSDAAWMRANCAKSCGICGATDSSCQDEPFIKAWGAAYKCRDHVKDCEYAIIQESCPRSCGTCPSQVFC